MADLNLTKEHLPFLLNGIGTLHVAAKGVDLMQPIKPSDDDLAQLTFSGSGAVPFTVAAGNVNLGIDNQLTARLLTLWPGSSQANKSLLQPYGLENYFDSAENQNKVLLLFLCGESLGGKIDAKFAYTDLSAEVTLSAGADASYALLG